MDEQQAPKPSDTPRNAVEPKRVWRPFEPIKRHLQKKRAEREQYTPADRAAHSTKNATWAMVLLTGAIAGLGYLQWETLSSTDKSVEAQVRAAEAADRAYIMMTAFNREAGPTLVPKMRGVFSFRNMGRTPAVMRMNGGKCVYSAKGFPEIETRAHIPGVTDTAGRIPRGMTVIASNKDLDPFSYELDATEAQIGQARLTNGSIYCRAVIVYEDMRGNEHETAACVRYFFPAERYIGCSEDGASYYN